MKRNERQGAFARYWQNESENVCTVFKQPTVS